ncbi:MAG: alanine transaminase, partial [Bryobacteraceae bacterium]
REALVAVSPGIGFGPMGEGFVRFSLIENHHRIRQAARNIAHFLQKQGVPDASAVVKV